jgi:protein-tyrosine-phosphatase
VNSDIDDPTGKDDETFMNIISKIEQNIIALKNEE